MPIKVACYAVVAFCCFFLNSLAAPAEFGNITGAVRLAGEPLAAGKITFHRDNGQFVGAKIKAGEFTIDDIPIGTYKVTIEGPDVPKKYAADETSALLVMVKKDENNLVFELSP